MNDNKKNDPLPVTQLDEDFVDHSLSPNKMKKLIEKKKEIAVLPRRRTRLETVAHKTNASTNPRFKFFLGLCELKLLSSGNYLPNSLSTEVFGGECLAHIRLDDCIALASMEWLGINHL